MRSKTVAAATWLTLLLSLRAPASAHQLDEYLQATTLALEKHRIHLVLRLTPGVAVFPAVLAGIDTNGDRAISPAEQNAYAARVQRDLSLSLDGKRLPLRLVSSRFTPTQSMKAGRGYIELQMDAPVPDGGRKRSLIFENHHQNRIAVYLVNGLEPTDRDIEITSQNRNYEQSLYRLDYTQSGGEISASTSSPRPWWLNAGGWGQLAGAAALVLLAQSTTGRRKRKKPGLKAARNF